MDKRERKSGTDEVTIGDSVSVVYEALVSSGAKVQVVTPPLSTEL